MATLGATKTEFAADQSIPTTRVGELISQDYGHAEVPFELYMAEATTQEDDSFGALLGAFAIPIPDYASAPQPSQAWINLKLEIKITATYNGDWRLVAATDLHYGTWMNTTSSSYEESKDEVEIDLRDTDDLTTIQIWGRVSNVAATLSVRSILGLTAWFSQT